MFAKTSWTQTFALDIKIYPSSFKLRQASSSSSPSCLFFVLDVSVQTEPGEVCTSAWSVDGDEAHAETSHGQNQLVAKCWLLVHEFHALSCDCSWRSTFELLFGQAPWPTIRKIEKSLCDNQRNYKKRWQHVLQWAINEARRTSDCRARFRASVRHGTGWICSASLAGLTGLHGTGSESADMAKTNFGYWTGKEPSKVVEITLRYTGPAASSDASQPEPPWQTRIPRSANC